MGTTLLCARRCINPSVDLFSSSAVLLDRRGCVLLWSSSGLPVEVPFDEALVRFFWTADRVLEVVEIEIPRHRAAAHTAPAVHGDADAEEEGEDEEGGSGAQAAAANKE